MDEYNYTISMDVRDYECDMQGVVNNSVYQNYLEHARHEYLKSLEIDFAELTRNKIHLVVVRAELDYKLPLISGDRFNIRINMLRESRVRFAFYQDIFRHTDNKLIMKAKIIGTALNERGRPSIPAELDRLLDQPA